MVSGCLRRARSRVSLACPAGRSPTRTPSLNSQGFLITRLRAAPVVAPIVRTHVAVSEPQPRPPVPRYDLVATTPDVNLFPLPCWLATAQRVGQRPELQTLDYRENLGEPALRDALADHLGRTRGVIIDPDCLLITQGTAQGIDLPTARLTLERRNPLRRRGSLAHNSA
jgi:DNA-binding transcriptional MocR family regulator